jgi:hypothetical protein
MSKCNLYAPGSSICVGVCVCVCVQGSS